ncbi:DUF1304 domain-containing protein [Loktanella sp. F6476L]|uniref:DUF1304 domain-containing protein n=1 Tax=Loktanella sp. F6476L TaxID=2926405 RepID=UPI001FF64EE2|nr:DUF1304 domain-containing protein [Loktanella sp. F6476L]MCK0120599.1 DUF1304 domain-containing protein [Loktanella sp. F6476L]
MRKISMVFIAAIAALHFYIAWFEIFAWTTRGPKIFTTFPEELFEQTIVLAGNQGIYNAFLAVGLVWSLLIKDRYWSANVATCFLLFVAAAGLFGAATASPSILFVQTVPATIALVLSYLGRKSDS